MGTQEPVATDSNSADGNTEHTPQRPLFVFLSAIVPPILIFLVDEWAIGYGNQTHWRLPARTILFTLYVAQVAILATYLGCRIRSWFLRWTILVWVLALIDLRLATLAFGNSSNCLIYAFLSSQIGLLAFAATLGPWAWPWRLPSALVAVVVTLYCLFGNGPWDQAWSTVLLLQTVAMFPLFAILLLTGYRLRTTDTDDRQPTARAGFSFSIGHMLFWMLAAVPILTLGPYIDPQTIRFFLIGALSRILFAAVCLSIMPLLVVITVFANKHVLLKIVVSVILLTLLGAYMAGSLVDTNLPTNTRSFQQWMLSGLISIGDWWIGWYLLSAAFLAALLLMFRGAGYRLEHGKRTRSPFAETLP